MNDDLEVTSSRLGRAGTVGLIGLAVGALAFAAAEAGVDLGWFPDDGAVVRATQAVLAIGMLVLAGTSVWLVRIGRSLDASTRTVLSDELALFTSRRVAVGAFKATWVFIATMAALSGFV